MERLVQIANDMDDKAEGETFVVGRRFWIAQSCRKPREGCHRVAFGVRI